jgi:hypothetical protein
MTRSEWKWAWRYARVNRHRGSQSIHGVVVSPHRGARRQDLDPHRTYHALQSLHMERPLAIGDRQYYAKRARAIRKAKFRDMWAGC